MLTPGLAIGLFAFVAVMIVAAYLIQRLDTAISGDDETSVTDSASALSDQSADTSPRPSGRAVKRRT